MKVVLFCGGLGMRMREFSEAIPKPMVPIGYRPVLWHLMRYYAHHGHKEFILCLGYKGDVIKDYFLNYKEWLSNDFVLTEGGRTIELLNRDIDDWRITFVDTGMHANIGERLVAVRDYLDGEDVFLANYADGLTDCALPAIIDDFHAKGSVASFLCVRPSQTFHVVSLDEGGTVEGIVESSRSGLWINGGFFVLRQEIFDYIGPGEELVYEPFDRLIKLGRLSAYRYEGFWAGMDTFKDRQVLDELYTQGGATWEVWRPERHGGIDR
jgi:glucose-1-phosphate cytidylyltransferase